MNNQNPIDLDISVLLQELGLSDIPDTEKQKIATMFESTVKAKVKLKMADVLSDEDHQALDALGENEEAIWAYIAGHKNINVTEFVVKAAEETRDEMLMDVAYIKGIIDGTKE